VIGSVSEGDSQQRINSLQISKPPVETLDAEVNLLTFFFIYNRNNRLIIGIKNYL
jgi:hypothetical protein